jgi:hypothetical protein
VQLTIDVRTMFGGTRSARPDRLAEHSTRRRSGLLRHPSSGSSQEVAPMAVMLHRPGYNQRRAARQPEEGRARRSRRMERAPALGQRGERLHRGAWLRRVGRLHLAVDDEATPATKGRYRFPYGDFSDVHRCGLASRRHARPYNARRARQQGAPKSGSPRDSRIRVPAHQVAQPPNRLGRGDDRDRSLFGPAAQHSHAGDVNEVQIR